MPKKGTQCCGYGCKKRRKAADQGRSDSDGSEDEESVIKKKYPRTFHAFPKDPKRSQLWTRSMRRIGWTPTIHSRICSDHFLEKYVNRKTNRVDLQPDAVPTRFKKFPAYLKKQIKTRKEPTIRNIVIPQEQQRPLEVHQQRPLEQQVQQFAAVTVPFDEKTELKSQLAKANTTILELRRKLKTAQQKTRRMSTRIVSMKSAIREMKRQHSNSNPNRGKIRKPRLPKKKCIVFNTAHRYTDHAYAATNCEQSLLPKLFVLNPPLSAASIIVK